MGDACPWNKGLVFSVFHIAIFHMFLSCKPGLAMLPGISRLSLGCLRSNARISSRSNPSSHTAMLNRSSPDTYVPRKLYLLEILAHIWASLLNQILES